MRFLLGLEHRQLLLGTAQQVVDLVRLLAKQNVRGFGCDGIAMASTSSRQGANVFGVFWVQDGGGGDGVEVGGC